MRELLFRIFHPTFSQGLRQFFHALRPGQGVSRRPFEFRQGLVAVVEFAALVFFNHQEWNFFHPLVGGETPFALEAFPAAADRDSIGRFPRINHFVLGLFTIRAAHVSGKL